MKIAIFCPYNIFMPGGVQEHVRYQAEILRSRGHKVDILTPRPRGTDPDAAPEGVIFLGNSTRIKSPQATSADVSVSMDPESVDRVLENNYDILHVHEPLVPVAAKQILSRAAGRALRIGSFHAAMAGNRLGRALNSTYKSYAVSVLPHVDIITAVTPAAVGYIKDYTNKKINYIPNGVDPKLLTQKVEVERIKNQILFLGRLEKRKGAIYAIKAFELAKQLNPDLSLVIAGDGPLRPSLAEYVRRNGIEDVEFLGFVDSETKVELMKKSAVYTSPALYGESFGIVLVEAMAAGTPIVAHNNDGYKCVLTETGRLSLVDVHDIKAYADRLLLMVEQEDLQNTWKKWASKNVANYGYDKVVDMYEKLYTKSLQG